MPWYRTSEDMIRGLVRTASEARGTKVSLVADALRVLFTQFNQSTRLASSVANAVLVRSSIEKQQAVYIGRTVRVISRIVMNLKAIASTDPLPATAMMLSNLAAVIHRLQLLCKSRHQRQLHCALGSHEAVIGAIRVLQQVEVLLPALEAGSVAHGGREARRVRLHGAHALLEALLSGSSGSRSDSGCCSR